MFAEQYILQLAAGSGTRSSLQTDRQIFVWITPRTLSKKKQSLVLNNLESLSAIVLKALFAKCFENHLKKLRCYAMEIRKRLRVNVKTLSYV